jgi:Protein of unknown function (DUF998)
MANDDSTNARAHQPSPALKSLGDKLVGQTKGTMAKNTVSPVTKISPTAARLSFAGAATFALLLAALHFIKPELNPSWHFISEYAIGEYGWIMVLAFLSLALTMSACSRRSAHNYRPSPAVSDWPCSWLAPSV